MEVSHADRVVFPEDGITKGEVVAYYETVADRMLPFVLHRALTVERFPKGTGSKGFMQKNAPEHFSDDLIARIEVPKEGGGTTNYPVVLGEQAIAAFANLGVITFHAPPSTIENQMQSDWLIWDLDPPSTRFDLARQSAHRLSEVLSSFDIETILMTSGSNGYHLRARAEPTLPADEAAGLARGTAALAAAAHPDLMTLAFRKKERGDRVFVDWLRNAPYSTSVVPWSLRARPGASVAVPIGWDELDSIDPNGVRLRSIEERFSVDPWKSHRGRDLAPVADRVETAVSEAGIELEPFDRFRS